MTRPPRIARSNASSGSTACSTCPIWSQRGSPTPSSTARPSRCSAVYHDTADLTLFRWGITLRRREGGADEGWHMKLPVAGADGSSRDELRLPLDAGPVGSVPGAFVEVIAPLLREQPLVPVVTLSTERTPDRRCSTPTDGALVEIVDDTVSVLRDGRTVSVFREIEVEAVDPDDEASLAAIDRVVDVLVAPRRRAQHGEQGRQRPRTAHPGAAGRARAPGPRARRARRRRDPRDPVAARAPPAAGRRRRASRPARLRAPDARGRPTAAQRDGHVRAAHAARAVRPPCARSCEWMASELGAIRDTEVMIERLDRHAGRARRPRRHRACARGHRPAAQRTPGGRPLERARRAAQRPPPAARRRPHERGHRPARHRRRLRPVLGGPAAARGPHLATPRPQPSPTSSSTAPAPPGTRPASRRRRRATPPTRSRRSSARPWTGTPTAWPTSPTCSATTRTRTSRR